MFSKKETNDHKKIMRKTCANLACAFRREIQTSWLFSSYAEIARKQGYHALTSLFSACAFSEQIHAARHSKVSLILGYKVHCDADSSQDPHTFEEMIQTIVDQEREGADLYSRFIKEADEENQYLATISFSVARDSDAAHSFYCSKILESKNQWKKKEKQYRVCSLCGYLVLSSEDLCPSCGASEDKFVVY